MVKFCGLTRNVACLTCQVHHPPQGDADEDALWEPVVRRVPFPSADPSRGARAGLFLGVGWVAFDLKALPYSRAEKLSGNWRRLRK